MKSIVTTIVGIAAALAVMALGIFIPKALLAQEESKYFSEEQKRETTAAPTMMPQPLPTTEPITSPLPGAGHALDLEWLYNAKSLIENETYLKLREPLPFEMSMETAAFMAQNELELLSCSERCRAATRRSSVSKAASCADIRTTCFRFIPAAA